MSVLQEGEVVGLYIADHGVKPKLGFKERALMQSKDSVMARAGLGLVGDRYNMETLLGSYSGSTRIHDDQRQVTFGGLEAFRAGLSEMKGYLPIGMFRRNIITTGIDWKNTSGNKVRILAKVTASEFAEFEIGEECKPCKIPDEGKLRFMEAMSKEWRGGVRARVLETGLVAVGFKVLVLG